MARAQIELRELSICKLVDEQERVLPFVQAYIVRLSLTKGGIAMAKGKSGGGKGMTSKAASRIQSSTARKSGGGTAKGSFASRAQRAAAKSSKK